MCVCVSTDGSTYLSQSMRWGEKELKSVAACSSSSSSSAMMISVVVNSHHEMFAVALAVIIIIIIGVIDEFFGVDEV